MIRCHAGMTLENVSNAHFADRASGISLKPGQRGTLTLDTADEDCVGLADVFESVSRAVACGILRVVKE